MWKIPLSDMDFDDREIEAVTEVLRSKWLTMGEVTQRFERTFAEYIGVRHAIAVTNCTAALQLAYRALGIGDGDEIIVPSLTFVATANAAVVEGATPVFADITSENDLTISPADIERKITRRTRGITVMHYGGYPCDMDPILDIARERKLAVIEDAAHAPGATYKGRPIGTIGDIACFSFFSNKNLATGEGGMITTNRDDLADRVRLLRSHGMTSLTLDRHKGHSFSYDVLDAGYNFRIDEIRSAIGLVQISKLDAGNVRRAELTKAYRTALASDPLIELPFAGKDEGSVHYIMPALLKVDVDRERFMGALRDVGIQTSIHYPPIHQFTHYTGGGAEVPVTDAVASRLVTLPLYPAMGNDEVGRVASAVRSAATSGVSVP